MSSLAVPEEEALPVELGEAAAVDGGCFFFKVDRIPEISCTPNDVEKSTE